MDAFKIGFVVGLQKRAATAPIDEYGRRLADAYSERKQRFQYPPGSPERKNLELSNENKLNALHSAGGPEIIAPQGTVGSSLGTLRRGTVPEVGRIGSYSIAPYFSHNSDAAMRAHNSLSAPKPAAPPAPAAQPKPQIQPKYVDLPPATDVSVPEPFVVGDSQEAAAFERARRSQQP